MRSKIVMFYNQIVTMDLTSLARNPLTVGPETPIIARL